MASQYIANIRQGECTKYQTLPQANLCKQAILQLPIESENSLLELKNPHAVRAALEHRPAAVKEVVFYSPPKGMWGRIADQAKELKVPVRIHDQKEKQEAKRTYRGSAEKEERIGHAFAKVEPKSPISLEKMFSSASDAGETEGNLWIGLDTLQDPHNVGAIFRTAAFFGVRGIVVTKNQSAPISSTVYDIAAGGLESVPFAIETNLHRSLKFAKRAGLWILGTSEHAEKSIWEIDRRRPWMLLLGNEQKGLRRLTIDNCDELAIIPAHSEVKSLNVSVAAGIMTSILVGK